MNDDVLHHIILILRSHVICKSMYNPFVGKAKESFSSISMDVNSDENYTHVHIMDFEGLL
jgi:hypothetical protein